MKITILVSGFPLECAGGTEISTENIAKHLSDNGHVVNVVYPGSSSVYRYDDIFLHALSVTSVPFSFTYQSLKLERHIKSDMVLSMGVFMGVPAFFIKKMLGTPYIVYGRGSDVYRDYNNKSITFKAVLNNSNAIIALTEHMKTEMQKNTNNPIYVIPNGIDIDRFNKSTCLDKNRVLYVGGLREVKGVKYLIEAMKIILTSGIDANLTVVGDGKERAELELLVESLGIQNGVSFIGKVPNNSIPEIMSKHSVFVLPSLSEGFPVVLLEAMASGLPIVSTNVGGIPEIIDDGVNGLLVPPQSSEEIANKILDLTNNINLINKISLNNTEKSKKYSWDEVVQKLENVYETSI